MAKPDPEHNPVLLVDDPRRTAQQVLPSSMGHLQREKIELAMRLAGGIAHELNNPLSYVSCSYTELENCVSQIQILCNTARAAADHLRELDAPGCRELARALTAAGRNAYGPLDEELAVATAAGKKGVDRLADLTAGLRYLAEPPASRYSIASTDITKILRGLRQQGVDVCLSPPVVAHVRWDDFHMAADNIVAFLVSPSRTGCPPIATKRVRVVAACTEVATTIEFIHPALVLSGAECARLFDPRFVIDRDGDTGLRLDLGLAKAHKALHEMSASVSITSASDMGTILQVVLPRTEDVSSPP